jgi:hypothetical protein
MDLMKSTMQQLEAELKRGGAAIEILRRLFDGFDPENEWPDNIRVSLGPFSKNGGVTVGEIRKVLEKNPFPLGE